MSFNDSMEIITNVLLDCAPFCLAWSISLTIYKFIIGEMTGRRFRNDRL